MVEKTSVTGGEPQLSQKLEMGATSVKNLSPCSEWVPYGDQVCAGAVETIAVMS